MGRLLAGLACGAALLCGCGGDANDERTAPSEAGQELAPSLTVLVGEERVRFVLHLTNVSGAPVKLEFPTAQRHDVEVREGGGGVVWRWSDGRMFAQAVGRERLAPGETAEYEALWEPGARSGSFVAVARLTASDRAVEQVAEFMLP